jgi:integrase
MPVRQKRRRLFFDFFWRGRRCKEYTGLADTPENRRRCEKKMREVERDIRLGTFDYRAHFPRGSNLHRFYGDPAPAEESSFKEYVLKWQANRSPFLPDGRLAKTMPLHPSTWTHDRSVIGAHLLPAFGHLRLNQIDVARCKDFRRRLIDAELHGKTVVNISGLAHKIFSDAVDEGLIERNPMPKTKAHELRLNTKPQTEPDPFSLNEITAVMRAIDPFYRPLYSIWFMLGWRPSELVALRWQWLDFENQTITLKLARMPRFGGLEAPPKTGVRQVDCRFAPQIFATFRSLNENPPAAAPDAYVFTDPSGNPLSQDWLLKRVFKPALRRAGLRQRSHGAIRDTFISIAVLEKEDLGWISRVCGTSERMIWSHYQRWIPEFRRGAGDKVAAVLEDAARVINPALVSPRPSPTQRAKTEIEQFQALRLVEAGGIEPPSEDRPAQVTTRLFRDLELAARTPADGLPASTADLISGAAQSAKARLPSPLNDALLRSRGRTAGGRQRPLGR